MMLTEVLNLFDLEASRLYKTFLNACVMVFFSVVVCPEYGHFFQETAAMKYKTYG